MKYSELKYICLVIIFLLAVGTSLASSTEKYASFLAGVLLIEENKSLSSEQKVQEYKQLQQLTGISGPEALQFVESFRNNPAGFNKIFAAIIDELTGTGKGEKEVFGNGN